MEVAPGLEWKHIYWIRGSNPRGSSLRYMVKDAPCSGWQHAFVIPGEKRSTIFCPFSLQGFTVQNTCGELEGAKEPTEFNKDLIVGIIHDNWRKNQSYGFAKDYDTAALVLTKLNSTVPEQLMKGGEEDVRVKGGKTVENALKKPVPKEGKRGRFLAWFLSKGGTAPIREAMAEFGISRSNALSYLFLLKKDHGIGYELVGDTASIALPKGCKDPFTSKDKPAKKTAAKKQTDGDTDDSWLDDTKDTSAETDDWLGEDTEGPSESDKDGDDDSWLDE